MARHEKHHFAGVLVHQTSKCLDILDSKSAIDIPFSGLLAHSTRVCWFAGAL
jgi:hypothetical protein